MLLCFLQKKAVSLLQTHSSQEELEGLFKEWIWWVFEYLPLPYVVRTMDCFMVEGQKVLFRVTLAIVRNFAKLVRTNRAPIKQRGLHGAFIHCCKEMNVKN